jgi:hypothetical protein
MQASNASMPSTTLWGGARPLRVAVAVQQQQRRIEFERERDQIAHERIVVDMQNAIGSRHLKRPTEYEASLAGPGVNIPSRARIMEGAPMP